MPYLRIRDILERAIAFHKMLGDFYHTIHGQSQKESVKLLADYMARHEKVLTEQLSRVTVEQEEQIAEVWEKYEPEFATCRCFEKLTIDNNSSVDDIIDAGLFLNQCLINLYHWTAENAPTEGTRILFSNLEVREIAEKKKLARIRGM